MGNWKPISKKLVNGQPEVNKQAVRNAAVYVAFSAI